MSMKTDVSQFTKKVKFNIKNIFKKKVAVNIPVLHGDLLNNRIALITGGASGIGLAIAKSFLNNNCTVIIAGRNESKLKNVVKDLEKISKNIYYICLDITNIDFFDIKLKELETLLNGKKIDILVNNAGVLSNNSIGTTKSNEFDIVMDTNLKGTYFLSQTFFNYWKRNKIKGNILNIASSSSNRPATNPYSVSKWGLKGLTIGMAKKMIDYGIVVNGIAPGPTSTDMINKNKNNSITKSQYPLDRYIMPEEISNLAVFLVSEMGRMIVGDIVYMTGGIGTITIDDLNY